MRNVRDHFPDCPEAMIVSIARTGDRDAFEELVRRRQSWLRHLMRRCSGDTALAEDLAQQAFLKAWQKIHELKEVKAFGVWLKRIAVSIWLLHIRKKDPLKGADEVTGEEASHTETTSVRMDLDRALATLSDTVRLCIVLSYHAGMVHKEIAELLDMPLGTVKSHINRGTKRLQQILVAYKDEPKAEIS